MVGQAHRLLIVDDDIDLCFLLKRSLKRVVHSISAVHSLSEADVAIQQFEPTILLLDNNLPDGEGVKQIERFKATHPNLKILLTSAMPIEEKEVVQAGGEGFIEKPITPDIITQYL